MRDQLHLVPVSLLLEALQLHSNQPTLPCTSTGHSAPVTAAIFAPVPGITVDEGLSEVGHIIVAADYQGCIKVYVTGDVL